MNVKIWNIAKKIFLLQCIPMILALVFIAILSSEYLQSRITPFSKLGLLSVVERSNVKVIGGREITPGFIVKQRLFSSENNLGMVLVRFTNFNRYNTDKVEFRIRESTDNIWFYTNQFTVDQFQNDQYFTFGFPLIRDSKSKFYDIEIESLSGRSGNSVAISKKRFQFALVYKFTQEELRAMSSDSIIRLGLKKIIYAIFYTDYRVPIYVYIISLLFITSLIYRIKIFQIISYSAKYAIKVWKSVKKRHIHHIPIIIKHYRRLEMNIYRVIFATNYRTLLLVLFFIFALVIRILHYLNPENYTDTFFYQLGSGGDYEMFIRHASTLLREGNFGFWQNWWDWLFITRILAFFYYFFGFIGGIAATELLMVMMGSFVVIIPYYLLSRKHWFSVGGILGSIILCVNPLLIKLSLAYMIDTSAMYLYSLFVAAYFIAFERRSLYWLCLLGFTALTDGLNKVIWLLNDPLSLIAFIPLYITKSAQLLPRPRIQIEWKYIKTAIIPFFVFATIYSSWEIFIRKTIHRYYYLGDVFFLYGGGSRDYLHESLFKNVSLFRKVYILYEFAIRAINNLNDYIQLPHIVLWIIVGLLMYVFVHTYSKRFEQVKYLGLIGFPLCIIGYILNIYLHLPFEKYYIFGLYTAIIILPLSLWPLEVMKYLVLIVPYFTILISVVTTLPLPRLYGQVVLWTVIFIGFVTDQLIKNTKKQDRSHAYTLGVFAIIACIIFLIPMVSDKTISGIIGIRKKTEDVTYFRWINSSTPTNTVVVSSEGDDLLLMGLVLEKPFVYNSRFGSALLITKNQDPRYLTFFNFPHRFGNDEIFRQSTFVVSDTNPTYWLRRIHQGDDIFSPTGPIYTDRYWIYQYLYDKKLQRSLYRFDIKYEYEQRTKNR